jgi:AcrR family transcriptional regulator
MAKKHRPNDPEGLRRRLVDAAFTAFTTHGYELTSVHDLKRDTGATGGAFSHHFPTKKQLGLVVLRERVADAVEQTWIAPVLSAESAAHGIQSVFDTIIRELDQQGSVSGCPLNNLSAELARQDADFRAEIHAIFARWRDAIAKKLRADLRAGAVAELEPRAFATFVVAAYSGAMAMAKASQSTAPLRICAAELARALHGPR